MQSSSLFPNPPVALALLEIRHSEHLMSSADVRQAKSALREVLPVQRAESAVHLDVGPSGSSQRTIEIPRFTSRDRHYSVTYAPDSVSIETTKYVSWNSFRALIDLALRNRSLEEGPDGFERVGLRFINEVRVPGDQAPDWKEWVNSQLVPPSLDVSEVGLEIVQQQSMVQYSAAEGSDQLTLRYGAMNGPPAIISTPNLVRPINPGEGHFFLLDADASWNVEQGGFIPPYSSEGVLGVADRLHKPVTQLFENLITDRLKKEVLNVL